MMFVPLLVAAAEELANIAVPLALAGGVYEAYRGLRAKRRAREALQEGLAASRLGKDTLAREEVVKIIANRLSSDDKRQVMRALNQTSRSAETRYLRDIVPASASLKDDAGTQMSMHP